MSVTVSCQCHNTHWEKLFFFPLQKVYLSTRGVIDACRCQLSVSYYTLEKVLLFSFVESFPVYNGRKLIPVTVSRQCHITHLGKFFFFPLQKVFLSTRDLHHRPACHLSCQINGGKQINYNPQGSYNEPCIYSIPIFPITNLKGGEKITRIFKKRKWLWRENRLSQRAVLFTVCNTHEYYKR